jgi:hypothetical protein
MASALAAKGREDGGKMIVGGEEDVFVVARFSKLRLAQCYSREAAKAVDAVTPTTNRVSENLEPRQGSGLWE